MTTLYKPVLIESAEQAEALPLWTMATIEHHPQDALPQIAMRIVRGWRNRDLVDGRIPHADMIGWTALVPIEADFEAAANALADWDGADWHAETWDWEIPREAYRAGARRALSAALAGGRGAR